ncbi:MAG: response regulator transcription factor [Pseudomonas sp.]|nr:response regulator transcription factor [Pseudomonas sp.]
MRVLLVEDSVALADTLCATLKDAGYAVDWRADGRDALVLGAQEPYDLCVLDLGLPGLDGLEVLRQWRAAGVALPVLVLTARSNWSERVEGLRAGADDYLTKPFHPEELVLRLQGLLRRSHGHEPSAQLRARGLELDETHQHVDLVGSGVAPVKLSATEFKLLRYFMLHAGQLLSKTRLAEHLYEYENERDSNVIEVQINHLRGKLGRQIIVTRRGQGYMFVGLEP